MYTEKNMLSFDFEKKGVGKYQTESHSIVKHLRKCYKNLSLSDISLKKMVCWQVRTEFLLHS